MIKHDSIGSKIFDTFNYLFLLLFALSFILPFVYMFSVSISDPSQVALYKVGLLPKGFTTEAYTQVLSNSELLRSYWNSIRYTVTGTFFVLLFGSLTAYPLSQARFKYKKFFNIVFTITMFFSGGLIPSFLLMQKLGLIDTMFAVTLPGAFAFWNIVLLRTNFQALPNELYEAAYIDGANDWKILFQIVLPLSKAILATIALFSSVSIWNAFFGPLMYLNSPEKQPLSILLRRILISNEIFNETDVQSSIVDPMIYAGKAISMRMATIFLTIGPIVLVYPFAQKYFVKGVLVGSVKG